MMKVVLPILFALACAACSTVTITGDNNHVMTMQSNSGSLTIPVSALPGIP
jgi:hypothetical protein